MSNELPKQDAHEPSGLKTGPNKLDLSHDDQSLTNSSLHREVWYDPHSKIKLSAPTLPECEQERKFRLDHLWVLVKEIDTGVNRVSKPFIEKHDSIQRELDRLNKLAHGRGTESFWNKYDKLRDKRDSIEKSWLEKLYEYVKSHENTDNERQGGGLAQIQRMQANIHRLEAHRLQLEDLYTKFYLSEHPKSGIFDAKKQAHLKAESELAGTYKYAVDLLEKKSTVPGIKKQYQLNLAEQILRNTASITAIDQGQHSTCSLTADEKRLWARSLAQSARLVSEVGLTGTYLSSRHHLPIKIDRESLLPDKEALSNPPADSDRGYASQIFQVTEANVCYKATGLKYQYEQHKPGYIAAGDKSTNLPDDDNGTRLKDLASGKYFLEDDGKYVTYPAGACSGEAPEIIYDEIAHSPSEKRERGWYFSDLDLEECGVLRVVPSERGVAKKTKNFTPADFANQMTKAIDEGKAPLIVDQVTDNPPYWHSKPGYHSINIDGYTKGKHPGELPTFFMDNHWGPQWDEPNVSVYSLFRARFPDFEKHPNAEKLLPLLGFDKGSIHGQFANDYLQLDTLQKRYQAKQISIGNYFYGAWDQIDAVCLQKKIHRTTWGPLDKAAYDPLAHKIDNVVKDMPAKYQKELKDHMKVICVSAY